MSNLLFLTLAALLLAACAHAVKTAPELAPIVCGMAPDGDRCCVSVLDGKLIQRCRSETDRDDQMRMQLDKTRVSDPDGGNQR